VASLSTRPKGAATIMVSVDDQPGTDGVAW